MVYYGNVSIDDVAIFLFKKYLFENKALVTNTEDYTTAVVLYEIKNAQKTRKWTAVTVETFELLEIAGVTVENIEIVITAFNTLKAGTGTSTLDEI